MTKLAPAMYELCRREAIKKGPRVMKVNGQPRTVYALNRKELAKIFVKEGYREDRIAWLKIVIAFRDIWEEAAPNNTTILNPNESWSVAFIHNLTDSEILDLKYAAEDQSIPSLVAEA